MSDEIRQEGDPAAPESVAPAPAGPAQPPQASSLAQVFALGMAGLLSGVILAGVYIGTEPMIQRNHAEALRAAVFQVLPGTETMRVYEWVDGRLVEFVGEGDALPEGEAVYAGLDGSGESTGWAIPAAGAGFQDTIGMLYGYDPVNERIVGLAILECRETPGLGDKIIFDENFHAGFRALAVDPEIVSVKDGRDAPNEVDVISGATISTNAVVRTLNLSVERWRPVLRDAELGGSDEP